MALLIVCSGCGKVMGPSQPGRTAKTTAPPTVSSADAKTSAKDAVEPKGSPDKAPAELALPVPESAVSAGESPAVIYSDSFADVTGSIKRRVEGAWRAEGPANTRVVYTFMATPEEGPLTMRVAEDKTTLGADGEPGVLALSWEEIPKALQYSGFVYLGGVTEMRRMTLPQLKQVKTAAELQGMRLKFRYQAVNPSSDEPVQLKIHCRLEPAVADSFARRIDFGTLTATQDWQIVDVVLGEGKNIDAFLNSLMNEEVAGFKIVWGQGAPVNSFRPGDTLLIDDISITSAAATSVVE